MGGIDALVDEGLGLHFSMFPAQALELGLHEYDGEVADYKPRAIERWIPKVHGVLYRLRGLEARSTSPDEKREVRLLGHMLEGGLFQFERFRVHEVLPAFYLFPLSPVNYIARDYAPLEDRMGAVYHVQTHIPDLVRAARANLRPNLPGPYIDLALMVAEGLEHSYQTELPPILERVQGPHREKFVKQNEKAPRDLARFRRLLEKEYKPRATNDFAIGEDNFLAMLRTNEGLHMSIAELKTLGQVDLERNERAFVDAARAIDPNRSPMEVMMSVNEKHPTAQSLIPDTAGLLEELRSFLIDRHVVSVPSEVRAQVTETPAFMRAVATAAMNPPGAFEKSDEAYYYITPVDPSWTPEKQEEWLRYMSYPMLKNVSIHEAYPGHYVHFLHVRHRTQGRMPRTYASYAFTEGWAHYTEEMLLEMGYGQADPGLRMAQLQDALLRNCRYMVTLGLHTGGMTLEEATKLFMEHGFMERLPAEREAFRGTFDPGYLSYTLGKLIILRLRREYMEKHPGATLEEFHDKLLSFGAPPVGMLRELLLDGTPSGVP